MALEIWGAIEVFLEPIMVDPYNLADFDNICRLFHYRAAFPARALLPTSSSHAIVR